ncbi:MAG: nucleotidyl transferase AbiEii/AbiGii toxin family protein [Candidatus Parvarchaeota archaeon]|jgi:Uncharacterized conserved protein|nr:nucleotidyl transferase AbiEii/AbiGii toxin family protein [Candidatus Parvarchaeota archaeon]MCL5420155.1 nucleotidyl transferase AbiEii/AbiGii toxin family protein [Candidatus Parvarchaeota archaeon]
MELDFEAIASRTGISTPRIKENLKTYDTMMELFPRLEAEKQLVGLYGGTAMNKIYYGKDQRLSYDIDLFCYNYPDTVKAIEKMGGVMVIARYHERGRSKMRLKGINIDLWAVPKKTDEMPSKKILKDLLYYYGYLIPPLAVPSYSLEYLLASKTMAMADRNMLKDIYDLWRGLKLAVDLEKYKFYIKKIGKELDIDVFSYIPAQIAFMLKNTKYYEKESIDTTYQPPVTLMLNEVKAVLESI